MTRTTAKRRQTKFMGAWIPERFYKAVERLADLDDSDISKFARKAMRERAQRLARKYRVPLTELDDAA